MIMIRFGYPQRCGNDVRMSNAAHKVRPRLKSNPPTSFVLNDLIESAPFSAQLNELHCFNSVAGSISSQLLWFDTNELN